MDDYHFNWDTCNGCANSERPRISEISWSEPHPLLINDLCQLIQLGDCHYCGSPHIKCQGCGMIIEIDEFELTNCMCGLTFGVGQPRPGEDLSVFDIIIKEVEENYKEENFVDPKQIKLWN